MKAVSEQKKRKDFGKLIKRMRKSLGMTQDKLAEKLNISRTAVTNYERGKNIPKLDIIIQINELLAINQKDELIKQYLSVHHDKNDLLYLARKFSASKPLLARLCMKEAFRIALNQQDTNMAVSVLFELIMWDLKVNKAVNRRKVDFIIKAFDTLDPDKFADLLGELYKKSFDHNKQFKAFIKISENVVEHLKLEEKKAFVLRFQYANALYYEGKLLKAFESTTEALRYDLHNVDQITLSKVYSRHGLICMQLNGHQEALKAFFKCLEIHNPEIEMYCYHNIARTYYMLGEYEKASEYWDKMFEITPENDFLRINALNDICMMFLLSGNIEAAKMTIPETIRLFKLAKEAKWHSYKVEKLLFERNKAFIEMIENGESGIAKVTQILNKLKCSYLQDEYNQTKNLLVEMITLSCKL